MIYRAEARPRTSPDGLSYLGWDIVGEGEEEALRLEDVTEDAAFARALAEALNREGAERVHVYDIISDFLSDSGWKRALLEGGI
ncbi:MAG: hypothetical protein IKO91_00870 [Oscillospiraceae bacterium]|nr:hypothetical protein [Oscillospiraceae bacterium]